MALSQYIFRWKETAVQWKDIAIVSAAVAAEIAKEFGNSVLVDAKGVAVFNDDPVTSSLVTIMTLTILVTQAAAGRSRDKAIAALEKKMKRMERKNREKVLHILIILQMVMVPMGVLII